MQILHRAWSVTARLWEWWGWIESHVGRIALLLSLPGAAIWVGAIVIARLQGVAPLTFYLTVVFVPLALAAFGSVAVVHIRTLIDASSASSAAPAEVRTAKLNVIPIHTNQSAQLRVENLGAKLDLAFRMLRIGPDDQKQPYRMKWVPALDETVPGTPRRGQVILKTGEIRKVDVAYVLELPKKNGKELIFPWPDDLQVSTAIDFDEIEVEIDVETSFEEVAGKWPRTYLMEFENGYITEFLEKQQD